MRLLKGRLAEDTKGFYCENCWKLYQNSKKQPACMKNACPVQDVAPDIALNHKLNAFLQYEALDMSPGARTFQEKLLKDSGLDQESAETILELKSILAQYKNKEPSQPSAPPRRR